MTELSAEIERLARVPVLLVASDYDGTLAPIVDDPQQARPEREALVAIRALAAMPGTHVAVISGRALRDLSELMGRPSDVHLVGSHGSEFDLGFARDLPSHAQQLRERVREELAQIAGGNHGFHIEEKPASIAFHYRQVAADEADAAVEQIMSGPAAFEGVYTKQGKKVVELAVVCTNKGYALESIRHRVGASAVLFLGDDITDEDAFATLKGPDLGIKIGEGETRAPFRLADTTEAARVLAQLCELRAEWLAGCEGVPIEAHAMLSDQRTMALATPDARIVWLCYPRIDSPAIFAELLGGPTAGHFSITPIDEDAEPTQHYLDHSLLVKTQWPTVTVTDYLDCSEGRPYQRPGRTDLVRIIEGTGRVRVEFAPRLDFGRIYTRLRERDGGLEIEDTHDPIVLRAPGITWELIDEGPHQKAVAEVELGGPDADPITIELRCGTGRLRPSVVAEPDRREQTRQYWNRWEERLRLPETAQDLVRRSALTLRGLHYGPTGAFLAAATTSLPESIGGVRNWDYRHCWLRDGALSAAALVRLGSNQEAMQFLDWVLHVLDTCESPDRLHPVYTVSGEELGPEAEIGELAGYRGSRPVRIGNAASRQVQLDVFGPIVDLVALLIERGAPLSSSHWRLVEAMVQAVEQRWREPDHGIWEVRLSRRHHVHSKVMCWLTIARAITIADQFFDREPDGWHELRDEIAAEILEKGWSDERGAFTAVYGSPDLDAAVLHVGLDGLIQPDDERFVRTVEAIEQELRDGPVVYRYRYDDGLPGREGGFHLCTSWLIEAYVKIGRVDDARELFDGMCGLVGQTQLMPEQYDSVDGISLGNHPQAFSHLGLINNAVVLDAAAGHGHSG